MFKFCIALAFLACTLAAPAPKPAPEPKPKPHYYATAYTIPAIPAAAPVISYTADLAAPIVYADEYYEPAAYYTAYTAPLVVV